MSQIPVSAPPTAARRRARLVLALLLVVAVGMATVAGLFDPSSDTATALVIFSWLIVMFLPFLPCAMRPVLHGTDVTAWTLTGRRTVDLRRLAKVERLRLPGQPRSVDMLMLLDLNGVRLFVDRPEVDAAVRTALMATDSAEPRVSPNAGHRLGLLELPLGDRILRVLGGFGLYVLFAGLTLVGVITISVLIGMAG
jgi:hypothetical protein